MDVSSVQAAASRNRHLNPGFQSSVLGALGGSAAFPAFPANVWQTSQFVRYIVSFLEEETLPNAFFFNGQPLLKLG